MDNLTLHLSLVKEQEAYHEKQARKLDFEPWRRELHAKTAGRFRSLAEFLVSDTRSQDEKQKAALNGLALTLEEVEGLPPELVAELSISEADKLEFAILAAIREAGGILNLDRILIALFKRTGEIYKRNTTTSKLYRMIQKGLIFPVGARKGVYSLTDLESGIDPDNQGRLPIEDSDAAD